MVSPDTTVPLIGVVRKSWMALPETVMFDPSPNVTPLWNTDMSLLVMAQSFEL
jgi:hypothetical protein